MDRKELIGKIEALANAARHSGHLPAAGVLFSLAGAVSEGSELELFDACALFSTRQLERLTGEVDWSDDTLKVG
jgi:hypothetical protein